MLYTKIFCHLEKSFKGWAWTPSWHKTSTVPISFGPCDPWNLVSVSPMALRLSDLGQRSTNDLDLWYIFNLIFYVVKPPQCTLAKYNTTSNNRLKFIQTRSHTICHWFIWTCILKSTAVALHTQMYCLLKFSAWTLLLRKKYLQPAWLGVRCNKQNWVTICSMFRWIDN